MPEIDLQRLVVLAGIGDEVDPYTLDRQRTIKLRHLGSGRELILKPIRDEALQELLMFLKHIGPAHEGDPRPARNARPQYVPPPEAAVPGEPEFDPQVPADEGLSFDVGGFDMSGLGSGADPTSDF